MDLNNTQYVSPFPQHENISSLEWPSTTNPSLEGMIGAPGYVIPEKHGFPCFVKLKNSGDEVRVIAPISGSGFFDLLVLRRNGEMFQIGITECIAFENYVDYMFDQQDILTEREGSVL